MIALNVVCQQICAYQFICAATHATIVQVDNLKGFATVLLEDASLWVGGGLLVTQKKFLGEDLAKNKIQRIVTR